jgi:hypothetical protein
MRENPWISQIPVFVVEAKRGDGLAEHIPQVVAKTFACGAQVR